MFQIFMMIGWAVLLVILLYMWADIREISEMVKENKREMLRSNIGGRTAAVYPNLRENSSRKAAKQESGDGEAAREEAPEGKKESTLSLNESEEQVLREVLTEFLG